MASETRSLSQRGKDPIAFSRGKLHRALGVPEGEKIPEAKKRSALSGAEGPEVKKMAVFGFRGVLAKGRQTAASNRRASR